MQIQLGLRDVLSGAHADVHVDAPHGTPLGDVADDLLGLLRPDGGTGPASVGGTLLTHQSPLGIPPLVDGALLRIQAPSAPAVLPNLPTLDVIGGPAAGTSFLLTAAQHTLGRVGPLALHDPDVSRAHCQLTLAHEGASVTDLGATNGTCVDGARVTTDAALAYGALLHIGSSVLELRRPTPEPPAPVPTGDGGIAFNRAPRVVPAHTVVQVVVPGAPTATERNPLPVLAMLAPLALGVVMWRVLGNASFLLFTLLSPVLMLANVVTDRRSGRRRTRRELAQWRAAREVAERTLYEGVRADERRRRTAAPDPATVSRLARDRAPGLWARRVHDTDLLLLRIGLADQPAHVEAEGDVPDGATTSRSVPATVAITERGVLGVAGPPAPRAGLARWLVVQAAALHSPGELQIVIVAGAFGSQRWDWVRTLPHLQPRLGQNCRATLGLGVRQATARVAELHALLDERRRLRDQTGTPVLLVVDGAHALRGIPGLATVLTEGPELGIYTLALDETAQQLPTECGATAVLHGNRLDFAAAGAAPVLGVLADQVDEGYAEAVARAVAPLREVSRDRGSAAALPSTVRWTDTVALPLSGGDEDVTALLARWEARSRSTAVTLGIGPEGAYAVDLAADGPHALVAGTTGAGKSELLQTLIASLVSSNRPDDLQLVLVDYKGGAAFGPCARLPHTVGMVTDLDGALVERALASLTAELKRRERVLATAGAQDLADLRRRGGSLARLVIVVDEFASLAEELPDFVRGLVGIAQRGRSLGVHLVLATQRPEGAVSADIRANTNLRLCLAVTRDTESRDVLDSPAAATISRSTPGRGYARTGHAELTPFQTGRVGGIRPPAVTRGPQVQLVPTADLGDPAPSAPTPQDGVSDLHLLVDACVAAAQRLGLSEQRSPWLAPLPEVVPLQALTSEAPSVLPLGLVDLPQSQSRATYGLDLAGGHLLVVGAPRSGRTTALLSLAGAVATQTSPDDVHVYALDLGSGLGALDALPHTGAVVSREQPERMVRVLDFLAGEVSRRQTLLAACGATSLSEQRSAGDRDALPHLLLLLDRWEGFLSTFQDIEAGRLVDVVYRLLREGPGVGLQLVVTADRSGLVGRLGTLIEEKVVLRLADLGDYAAAGLPTRAVPEHLPPGRGWRLSAAPTVLQLAVLADEPSGSAQTAALRRLAGRAAQPVRCPPRQVASLPDAVQLTDLPAPGAAPFLGVGGDELEPVAVDLTDGGFVIGGPPRSGRSTALLTLAGQLDLPMVAICPRPSPLRALQCCVTDVQDVATLQALLACGPVAVVVDDAELVVDSPVGSVLEHLVRSARDNGSVVIAAGTTEVLVACYRGFVADLRRLRNGLLLSPESPADGDLLGVRTQRAPVGVPGRGLHVTRAGTSPVQVALPSRKVAAVRG